MTFYKDGYIIVRGMISKEEAIEIHENLKEREFNGEGTLDIQSNTSLAFYQNELMKKKLIKYLPNMEKYTGLELFKTYAYARIYKNGEILRMHRDRPACEVSVTLDLGGDHWDLWVLDRNENPINIKLNIGDALIYRGCEINHWRGKFKGEEHTQIFMHYVDKYGPCSWAKDDIKK